METISEEIITKPSLLVKILKAIKCKMTCCSGSSCQVGEYQEAHPAVSTKRFSETDSSGSERSLW
jgi:hypothetical protein